MTNSVSPISRPRALRLSRCGRQRDRALGDAVDAGQRQARGAELDQAHLDVGRARRVGARAGGRAGPAVGGAVAEGGGAADAVVDARVGLGQGDGEEDGTGRGGAAVAAGEGGVPGGGEGAVESTVISSTGTAAVRAADAGAAVRSRAPARAGTRREGRMGLLRRGGWSRRLPSTGIRGVTAGAARSLPWPTGRSAGGPEPPVEVPGGGPRCQAAPSIMIRITIERYEDEPPLPHV